MMEFELNLNYLANESIISGVHFEDLLTFTVKSFLKDYTADEHL